MSDVTLPVHPDTIHEELESVARLIGKWRDRVGSGIVGVDIPAPDAEVKLEAFMREFVGELLLVSGKCQNLALILVER